MAMLGSLTWVKAGMGPDYLLMPLKRRTSGNDEIFKMVFVHGQGVCRNNSVLT